MSQETSGLHHRQSSFGARLKGRSSAARSQLLSFLLRILTLREWANPPPNTALLCSPFDLQRLCSPWPQHSLGRRPCFARQILKGRGLWAASCSGCIPSLQHPKPSKHWAHEDAGWNMACTYWEGQKGCGSRAPAHFVPWAAPRCYREVPKLHSKTAPRYSTHFAILLRSIQQCR